MSATTPKPRDRSAATSGSVSRSRFVGKGGAPEQPAACGMPPPHQADGYTMWRRWRRLAERAGSSHANESGGRSQTSSTTSSGTAPSTSTPTCRAGRSTQATNTPSRGWAMGIRRGFAGLAMVAFAAGCGSATAPAAPIGFFPRIFSGPGFVTNAELIKASAVSPATRKFAFHAVAPKSGGWALVVRCYSGTVRADNGASYTSGPCRGTSGMIAGCAGGLNEHLSVTVDQKQPQRWGIAIYRSGCTPPTAEERRIKEQGAPH